MTAIVVKSRNQIGFPSDYDFVKRKITGTTMTSIMTPKRSQDGKKQINQYVIITNLGSGSFGKVLKV